MAPHPINLSYLKRSTSLERQFDGFRQLPISCDLASAIPVEIRVHDPVKGLLEVESHIHVSGRASELGSRSIEVDGGREVVELCDGAVEGTEERETLPLILDGDGLLVVVGLGQAEAQRQKQEPPKRSHLKMGRETKLRFYDLE